MSDMQNAPTGITTPHQPEPEEESGLIGLQDLPPGAPQSVLDEVNAMSRDRQLAQVAAMPEHNHSLMQQRYSLVGGIAKADSFALFEVLADQVRSVQKGDLSHVEATLMAQVKTLDTMFIHLAARAEMNIGEHMKAAETYLRLAMKAQSQCRATAETLAEIKSPRSVAFVRQANIANNQQVNNGQSVQASEPRAVNQQNEQSELLEVTPSERLDTRTTRQAGGIDSALEAVGSVNRPDEPSRQTGGSS